MVDSEHGFTFCRARYAVELTGKKARNLEEFKKAIETIDKTSFFYHIHHALLDYHFLPKEYPNDFAFWIADVLNESELAEKIANVDLLEMHTIEDLRAAILEPIRQYGTVNCAYDAPIGQEFYFVKCVAIVIPTHHRAHDLDEFLEMLRILDEESIFYHLVAARLLNSEQMRNDFSLWIEEALGDTALANAIATMDPYGFNTMESLHAELVKTIENQMRGA